MQKNYDVIFASRWYVGEGNCFLAHSLSQDWLLGKTFNCKISGACKHQIVCNRFSALIYCTVEECVVNIIALKLTLHGKHSLRMLSLAFLSNADFLLSQIITLAEDIIINKNCSTSIFSFSVTLLTSFSQYITWINTMASILNVLKVYQ